MGPALFEAMAFVNPEPKLLDASLVAGVIAGDGEARGALYDRLAPAVQRVVVALGLRGAEVEDALQETFLRLFRDLGRFDPERPLRPYVLGIARRVALEAARQRRPGEPAPDDLPSRDTPAPERAERAERRALVRDALAALGDEHRAALALRHAQRLTMQELADSLSCSVPTARSRLREAARRFAAELRQRGVLQHEEGAL